MRVGLSEKQKKKKGALSNARDSFSAELEQINMPGPKSRAKNTRQHPRYMVLQSHQRSSVYYEGRYLNMTALKFFRYFPTCARLFTNPL